EWNIPLRDHDHVFLKGHRIMVQIQSTWFPLIDRNTQKFVPSIYKAVASDFTSATQRIYCSTAMPSHVVLPVMHYGSERQSAGSMRNQWVCGGSEALLIGRSSSNPMEKEWFGRALQ